jgi:hypothetical protein
MAGFHPGTLTATAGQPLQLQIINPDSNMHSDGLAGTNSPSPISA